MIAYHGSNSNFRKFRIHKSLVNSEASARNEGLGIYFSTNIDVAKSYGKYLYIMEINDKAILDFRKISVCKAFIYNICKEVFKRTGADISWGFNIQNVASYLYEARIAISNVHNELWLLLDSNEDFYKRYGETQIERIRLALKMANKEILKAYTFNYHIPNIGIIKDVSDNVVRIIKKERIA